MFTFRLCKGCHPKLDSIYKTAQGPSSKGQSKSPKKASHLIDCFPYMTTENECLTNPNPLHEKWKKNNYSHFAN